MNRAGYKKPAEILLVEDSPIDITMVQEALTEGAIMSNLHIVMNGEDAVEFMKKKGKYQIAPRPDIVFLDLNFPQMDGRDVLREIKTDPDLRRIPIVILTSSKAEEDIHSVYDLHANCYVTKPRDLDQFLTVVKEISKFWLTIAALPSKPE